MSYKSSISICQFIERQKTFGQIQNMSKRAHISLHKLMLGKTSKTTSQLLNCSLNAPCLSIKNIQRGITAILKVKTKQTPQNTS